MRVLLADDDHLCRRLVVTILRRADVTVVEAEDGADAVRLARQCARDGEPVDVAVLDCEMPEMDGPTAARALRASGFAGALVLLTGHDLGTQDERVASAGFDVVLGKPVHTDTLVRTLREVAGRAAATGRP